MSFGSVLNIDPAVFKRVIDIDLLGVFHTVKAVLPSLIERKGYALIVSSAAAYSGSPGLTPYNAAKAGVENFANGFRTEVADLGVAVGTAHMSWVDTPMTRETKSEITTFHKMYGSQLGPMSRMATPQQCAEAFATAIQRRSRHVYCPRWVGILPWIRPLISTRVAERPMRTLAREMLPQLDAEAAAHGRGLTARVESLGSDDIEP
jgi:NAD(P)-dependent dehydrogenase (short-subunit alcohol dehydrogenase family)